MMIGTLFDIGIWFYADRLKGLYEEEDEEEEEVKHPSVLPQKQPLPIDFKTINAHELTPYENGKTTKSN